MKKIVLIAMILFSTGTVWSQKWGYVDVESILEKIDEYNAIQKELEQLSTRWQKELEEKYKAIETAYKKYQEERVLLPEDVRQEREEEIYAMEREAKEFKEEKFGYEGELFKVQQEKLRPVQEQVYQNIEEMAREKRLDFILDISSNTVVYKNDLFDRTQDVTRRMGISE